MIKSTAYSIFKTKWIIKISHISELLASVEPKPEAVQEL